MKTITLTFCLLAVIAISGQTPGNVGSTNLTAWFTAESLSPGNVSNWSTSIPSGASAVTVTDNSSPFPEATNTPSGNVSNYNMTIEFANNTYSNLKALQSTSNIDLIDNSTSTSEGTYFCAYYIPQTSNNGHIMLYNELGNDGIQLRNLGTKGRLAIGRNLGQSTSASNDWTESFIPSIVSYRGNRSTSTSYETFHKSSNFQGGVASQSSGSLGLYFGVMPSNVNSALNGYIHEVLFYNRTLGDTEIRRIHTYLAIKYGVTLLSTNGGSEGDYEATDGTLVWDASSSIDYHNDVIGLARDDDQGLSQKQSHSFDDTTRIYIGTLSNTNNSNQELINNNLSYLMVGHNSGLMCSSISSNQEIPANFNIVSRLDREWKIKNSQFNQSFNMDLTLKNCINPSAVEINRLCLLIDEDGDFTNASVYENGNGITITHFNGIVTIENIDNSIIPANEERYLTLGYAYDPVTVTSSINQICNGDSLQLFFNNNTSTPFSFNYTDGSNVFTVNSFQNGDFIYVSPNTNTTYSILNNNPFLNCCNVPVSNSSLNIQVNQLPNVTAVATSDTLCYGQSTTLFSSGANQYIWSNGVIEGQLFTPLNTQTYTVMGTDVNGCKDDFSLNIIVAPETSITLGNDTTICPQVPLTLSLDQNFNSYLWFNGSTESEIIVDYGGLISLMVQDEFGCQYEDSIFITISDKCSESLYVPNVFTPNGDGINDSFSVFGLGLKEFEISIYNRWGNLVYNSQDMDFNWDGKNNHDEICSDGVYIYAIKYTVDGIQYENITGHLTLIK